MLRPSQTKEVPESQAEEVSCRGNREPLKAFEQECHTVQAVGSISLISSVHRGLGGGKREYGSRDASEGASGRTPGLQIILLVPRILLASFWEFITVPWNN